MSHINRVVDISKKIAEKEDANVDLVIAIALLHDVDDYKLFGEENSENLTNAKRILEKTNFSYEEKKIIIDSIKTIGYSKRLEGIIPTNIEAMIVSDADMLDAIGANGIVRSLKYNIKHNREIFNRDIFPILNMDSEEYKKKNDGTAINHMFEKMLKLKDLMLTENGKKEAIKRHNFMVEFLKEFFYEINETKWLNYLDEYLSK